MVRFDDGENKILVVDTVGNKIPELNYELWN